VTRPPADLDPAAAAAARGGWTVWLAFVLVLIPVLFNAVTLWPEVSLLCLRLCACGSSGGVAPRRWG
jgi:hypothetical protein